MSRNSPKQYAEWRASRGLPPLIPALQERLRAQAGILRRRAAGLLAQSNELEEMANELDPPSPPKGEPDFFCCCGNLLTFETNVGFLCCFCARCKARSANDGAVAFVYGYGKDKATAFADWQSRMDSL